jgi:hypothetical protein
MCPAQQRREGRLLSRRHQGACAAATATRRQASQSPAPYVPSAAATRRQASQSPASRGVRISDEKAGFSVAGAICAQRSSDEKAGLSVAGTKGRAHQRREGRLLSRGAIRAPIEWHAGRRPSGRTSLATAVDRCGHHLRPGEISRRGTRFRHPRLVIVCSRVRVCRPPLRDRAPTVTGRVRITGAAPRATLVPADDARA